MKGIGRLSAWQHVSFSLYWFPISYLWSSLNVILLPILILSVAHESVKATAMGLVAFSGLAAAVVVQPMAGAASDVATFRWGRRRPFIAAGAFLSVVFLAALFLAPPYVAEVFGLHGTTPSGAGSRILMAPYVALFLSYLALQVASNVAHGPYQGLIPDLVPESERGRASGYMGAAQVAGTGAVFVVYAYLIHPVRLDIAVGSIMFALLAGMALTVLLVPDRPAREKAKWDLRGAISHTFDREVFRYRDFLWLLVSRFFILLGLDSIRDFAFFYVRDVLGLPHPAQVVGRLMIVIVASSLLSVLPAGYLSDRFGRKRLVIASAACGAVGGFFFLTSTSFEEMRVFGVLVGIAFGSFLSVDWAFATDLIPKSQAGRFLGISNIATAGASASSFILGGPIVDIFNARAHGQGYSALIVLVLAYFIVGTLALFKVREVIPIDQSPSPAIKINEEPPVAGTA